MHQLAAQNIIDFLQNDPICSDIQQSEMATRGRVLTVGVTAGGESGDPGGVQWIPCLFP